MKYSAIRSDIRSGDLLAFSRGSWRTWNDIKANLVRIFTRSTYNHVGLAWVVSGRVFILEPGKVSQCAAFVLEVLRGDGTLLGMRATPDAVVQEALALAGSELVFVEAGT